ncbi:MAG: ferredoxin:protochlorophyllide reductase (ATP-dependent) subunit B [Pseudomonadota bacterium]
MQLTVWSYEGPPHVGAMRIAASMRDVHYVLHAPQGDTYADLLFTMIQRSGNRPPVTYTTFEARDLGADTAEIFKNAARAAEERFKPKAMLVGASCTAELLQDDPAGMAKALSLSVPVIPLELPAYQKKENWGAAETFYQIVRRLADPATQTDGTLAQPKCNILGATDFGFRCRDDVKEISQLLQKLGVDINVCAPMGASPEDIARIPAADFNVLLYPEVADVTARWLKKTFDMPYTQNIPIGVHGTVAFIEEVAALAKINAETAKAVASEQGNMPWWSRSIDSTYLTGKRVFIFGDASHAVAAARVARDELGFEVIGLGCYNREFARDLRKAAKDFGIDPLITDDYLEVEAAIAETQPELVLGTQMERHIAKRFGIGCVVISAPTHVQDFPARYGPQMGFEGANVLFDTWVHPLVMGLEEHLLGMFREDFEFNDTAGPSHLAAHSPSKNEAPRLNQDQTKANDDIGDRDEAQQDLALDTNGHPSSSVADTMHTDELIKTANTHSDEQKQVSSTCVWRPDAEKELKKIPFFVRGKARRNTERYAADHEIAIITIDTLYDAKAHYAR